MPPPALDPALLALLPVVARWCGRLGGGRIDVEEAAHDVILLLRRRPPRPGVPLEAYAWGVTRRVVANRRRLAWWRRWAAGDVPEPAGTSVEDQERREVARRVHAVLDALPEEQREVLVLCDVEERSAPEVALLTGVPEGTVRSRLRLARARFRVLADAADLSPAAPPSAGSDPAVRAGPPRAEEAR